MTHRLRFKVGEHCFAQDFHPFFRQHDVVRFAVHGQKRLAQAHGGGVVGERKRGDERRALGRALGSERGAVKQGAVFQLLQAKLDLGEGEVEADREGEDKELFA